MLASRQFIGLGVTDSTSLRNCGFDTIFYRKSFSHRESFFKSSNYKLTAFYIYYFSVLDLLVRIGFVFTATKKADETSSALQLFMVQKLTLLS